MTEYKLGPYVEKLKFSSGEAIRIVAGVSNDETEISRYFKNIFEAKNGLTNACCAYLARDLKIQGHRVGEAAQKKEIYTRLLRLIGKETNRDASRFIHLYKHAVVTFFVTKLVNLNSLLKAESFTGHQAPTTLEIFKKIFDLSHKYQIELKDIRLFYVLWGFDRSTEVEALTKPIAKPPAQDLLVGDKELAKLRQAIIERFGDIESRIKDLERSSIEIKRQSQRPIENDIESRFELQNNEFKRYSDNFEKTIHNVRQEVQNRPDRKELKAVRDEVKDIQKNDEVMQKNLVSLKQQLESMNKELARVNEKVGRKFSAIAGKDSKQIRTVDGGKNAITELDFVSYWKNRLKHTPFALLNYENLLVAHLFFKIFNCVVASNSMLYDTWIDALGWKNFSKSSVAEPTWIRSSDCNELKEFCSASESPLVCKIVRFNSALVDAYLLPNVLSWLESEDLVDKRLILIVTPDEVSQLKSAVNQFPFLLNESALFRSHLTLSKKASNFNTQDSIFISSLSLWSETQQLDFEQDVSINRILNSKDIVLPPLIFKNFLKFKTAAARFFDDSSATMAAYELTVNPWIMYSRDEIQAEQVTRDILDVYG